MFRFDLVDLCINIGYDRFDISKNRCLSVVSATWPFGSTLNQVAASGPRSANRTVVVVYITSSGALAKTLITTRPMRISCPWPGATTCRSGRTALSLNHSREAIYCAYVINLA